LEIYLFEFIWFQGEYKVDYNGIINCNPPSDNNIMFYLYMYKVSADIIELRGNITNKIYYDDSLTVSNWLWVINTK